jgi:hypothetical protein
LFLVLKERLFKSDEKKLQQIYSSNQKSEYNLFVILLLAWILVFFLLIILNLYPQLAFFPSADIIRHFSLSKDLILAPDIYASQYPWFHFSWASVMELSSKPPMWLFQSGIAYLGVMSIFSFYIMAKSYLRDIDRRAPLLATVFFSVFSGFGWLYFIQYISDTPDLSDHFIPLYKSSAASNYDIGNGQGTGIWLWFRPLTVGFTIFFVLLYLMRRQDLTKHNYIIISSLLILTLSQVHFSELLIFIVFLLVLAFFFPAIKLRIKETAISALIGIAASQVINVGYQILLSFEDAPFSFGYQFILAALPGLSIILVHFPRRPRLSFSRINLTLVTLIALFIYFILLFHWFSNADSFVSLRKDVSIDTISAIPWEFYPMLLGIVGVFAIPGIVLVAKKYRSHPIIIFAVLLVFIVVLGRSITYINANFISTNFWEKRVTELIYASCSLLAPLVVLQLINKLNHQEKAIKHLKGFKNILVITFLSCLVLGGILSTFLSIDLQLYNLSKYDVSALTDKQINQIQSSVSNIDPHSTLLTVSNRSKLIAEFASLDYIIDSVSYHLWSSKSPEFPLYWLYSTNTPVIIYLNDRDLKEIKENKYENGYLWSHLTQVAPAIKKGFDGGDIIQTSRLSPTSSNSDVVLVLPEGDEKSYYYAYDILSLGRYNYTTAPLSDIDSISKAKIVITPSEELGSKIMHYKREYNLQYEKLIVLNLDGYGQLMDISDTTLSPLTIEDNASTEWIAAGIGTGRIGIPKLTDDPNTKISGNNSLAINVGGGKYAHWQVSKLLYDRPVNLTKFDFVKFHWYGRGDGKWYYLMFTTAEQNSVFYYRFQDSWNGWKQIILPLQMPDGRGHIFDVTFDKITPRQGASWAKITRIDVGTEKNTLNQAGEFYLDGLSFGNMLKSSNIKLISNKNEIQFSTNIDLYPIVPKSNYNITAYYNVGVPFALHRTYDGYDMFYLNVNPVIQKLHSKDNDARHIYPLLGKMLELIDIKLPSYKFRNIGEADLAKGGVAAFNNATFIGDLTLESSSALIDVDTPSIRVNVDGNHFTLNNVSQIIPINIGNVTVKSNRGIITGGSGFYTQLSLNQSSIHFVGHPATLLISFKDKSTNNNTTIIGKEVEINLSKSNVSVRQPRVTSNGIISFGNFYGYQELYHKIRVLGQDLIIEGQVTFNSVYSDKVTITRGLSFEGNIVRSQPIYPYDEFGSLANIFSSKNILLYIGITSLLFLLFNFYINKKKKNSPIGASLKTK